MTVAAAIAIALHEILAALVPGAAQAPPREVVAHAEVTRIARHQVVAPRHVVPPKPVRAAPQRIAPQRTSAGGRSAAASHAPTHHVAAVAFNGKPVWDTGNGRGSAPIAGTGTGTQGSGTGTQGNGTGAIAGDEPCGFVEFSDPHGSRYDPSTRGFYVDIRMSVHFADGSQQSVILDYPWYYASESANPWSGQNVKDPNFPTRFQAPPAARLSDEPQLVQYVALHSTTDGMTLLRDCQGASEQRP